MGAVKNILFIMCDQLRWDYLSCTGHRRLATPHLDALAARGVIFERAFVQSPICGPGRMSTYTGRYVSNHGSTINGAPLRADELTLGDHLRPLGMRVALVGKTHVTPDKAGLARLGASADSGPGLLAAQGGFEPYERDDGMHLDHSVDPDLTYNRHLNALGYEGKNPWHSWANSAQGANGDILSGWEMRHAGLPARVDEAHSETPYMVDRAIQFIAEQGDKPWCLHLSFIKPHWPYMVPAPYHRMFGREDCLPVHRDAKEPEIAHPVHKAFMQNPESVVFSRDEARATVIPTYMGLIKQIDDHLGRLFKSLEAAGRFEDTMIVFTSDHGDFLGDHWLGEKELFYECSARVPLIVYDPDTAADGTRGTRDRRLVESIDLAPTFVEAAGGKPPSHILEGRSLLPLLRANGASTRWRDAVFSELDYSPSGARLVLGVSAAASRAAMVRTERWKYVHYQGFEAQLFDLSEDPAEFRDVAGDPGYLTVRNEMQSRLHEWLCARSNRVTIADAAIESRSGKFWERGVFIGKW
jgi:arylsulfatase A-like enzyme